MRTIRLAIALLAVATCVVAIAPRPATAGKDGAIEFLDPGQTKSLPRHTYSRFALLGCDRWCVRMKYADTGNYGRKMCARHNQKVVRRYPNRLATPEITNEASTPGDECGWEGRY